MPAVIVGIALGPVAASFLNVNRWIDFVGEHRNAITLVCSTIVSLARAIADYLGHMSSCHWRTAGYCRLPTTGQIPATAVGRNAALAAPHHDNHVAMHHGVHHACGAQPQLCT